MGSYELMCQKLYPLMMYDLDSGIVSAEMQSYAVALDYLEDAVREILSESFINTAVSYGITQREKLIGKERSDLDLETRRSMLLQRQKINGKDFTLKSFKDAFESLDFDCDIVEMPSSFTVSVESKGTYTPAQKAWIKSQAESLLPAHLIFSLSFGGYSWNDIESKGKTFSQIENLSYTWNDTDNL